MFGRLSLLHLLLLAGAEARRILSKDNKYISSWCTFRWCLHTHSHGLNLLKCNVGKWLSTRWHAAPSPPSYLWLRFVYLPPHCCSPFISCSGIPVKASLRLVSWTMMDKGGRRRCPHGSDQSTVPGLWQWPWRLIISPQNCSFMVLISCKLVSLAFLLKQFSSSPSVTEKKFPAATGMIRNLWECHSCRPHVCGCDLTDGLKEVSLWDKTCEWRKYN